MAERTSALAGNYPVGRHGVEGDVGVWLREVPGLQLQQIAAWPDTVCEAGRAAATAAGCNEAPGPCRVNAGERGVLLRVEPLKWWLLGADAPALGAELGATLDLSHSRTHVRVAGAQAATLINRHMPLDLRDDRFPVGACAATGLHHVGVTLWRAETGYELFLPRGYAESLWEMLLDSATQFGLEVV